MYLMILQLCFCTYVLTFCRWTLGFTVRGQWPVHNVAKKRTHIFANMKEYHDATVSFEPCRVSKCYIQHHKSSLCDETKYVYGHIQDVDVDVSRFRSAEGNAGLLSPARKLFSSS